MIIDCKNCTAPLMKDVELVSGGDAVFRAKIKCPHCKAPNTIEIRNSVVSVVLLNGSIVDRERRQDPDEIPLRAL